MMRISLSVQDQAGKDTLSFQEAKPQLLGIRKASLRSSNFKASCQMDLPRRGHSQASMGQF